MSQTSPTPQSNDDVSADETSLPPTSEVDDAASATPPQGPAAADESTVGTGTSMALGCIAGTVVLIIFGLLFLALSRLV